MSIFLMSSAKKDYVLKKNDLMLWINNYLVTLRYIKGVTINNEDDLTIRLWSWSRLPQRRFTYYLCLQAELDKEDSITG
jgi:hypothetical protein